MILRSVLVCLLICSLVSAYFHSPHNYIYDFSSCTGPTCHSDKSIGYGCINGNCTYVCSDGFCSGYQSYRDILPPISHEFLVSTWGHGAERHQGNCQGGNCGYWGGCVNGYCGGYYDFRVCPHRECQSGPFNGYGCTSGACEIVCFGRNCYAVHSYGKPFGKGQEPRARKNATASTNATGLSDIGETFRGKDRWMLRNLEPMDVLEIVRSMIRNGTTFRKMKPDGEEVQFILNEFRKRNRMQVRLDLWRKEKRAQLYMNTLCPHVPHCPYHNPRWHGGSQSRPLLEPYQPSQFLPSPPVQPQFSPQGPFNCPGGCSPPKPPMIPHIPAPQPALPNFPPQFPAPRPHHGQPRIPPQGPFNCPGGCPAPKPPMIPHIPHPPPILPNVPAPKPIIPNFPFPQPSVPYVPPQFSAPKPPMIPLAPPPPRQPAFPPKEQFNCPGGCPAPNPPMIPHIPFPQPPIPYVQPQIPAPKPPMIPLPSPGQPAFPPRGPFNCPGGCPKQNIPKHKKDLTDLPHISDGYYYGPIDPHYQKGKQV